MPTTKLTDGTAAVAPTCAFPACEGPPVPTTVMCEHHRLVTISRTGSWLEAG